MLLMLSPPTHAEQIATAIAEIGEPFFMKSLENARTFRPRFPGRTAFRLLEIEILDVALNLHLPGVVYWLFPQRRDMLRELARQDRAAAICEPMEDEPYGWLPWSESRLLVLLNSASVPTCSICERERTSPQPSLTFVRKQL